MRYSQHPPMGGAEGITIHCVKKTYKEEEEILRPYHKMHTTYQQ